MRANSALLTLLGNQMIEHTGKIDFACGDNKREGFFGVDKYKTSSTDAEFDLLQFPWPIADGSVKEGHCAHFFEHIPAALRPRFIEELHRVMEEGAKVQIIVPMGDRMFQDFTHQWPPVVPGSFLYFNKKWRVDNKLEHGEYAINADFDYTYGYGLHPTVAARNAEYQQYAIQFYNNAASDLYVTLTKK